MSGLTAQTIDIIDIDGYRYHAILSFVSDVRVELPLLSGFAVFIGKFLRGANKLFVATCLGYR
jgi:uncharacterized membrane protein